jgi:hypothetical protein
MIIYNDRVLIYRVFTFVAAILFIISTINPWWICEIYIPQDELAPDSPTPVEIYQYGLRHNFEEELYDYIAEDETPYYQRVSAIIYIALSVLLIIYSILLKSSKVKWLLGFVGIVYIGYAITAIAVIYNRLSALGIALLGESTVVYMNAVNWPISFYAKIGFGYYLAFGAGIMCIILSLLHKYIL